jgi:putative transposase
MPSFGSVGDAFDKAIMEGFRSTMQIELLDRRRSTARIELSNVIFEINEVIYDCWRRHSHLNYVSPIEFEHPLTKQTT